MTANNQILLKRYTGDGGSPFRSLTEARDAAVAAGGGVLVVPAGTWHGQDLLRDGVHWHFEPGAKVILVVNTNDKSTGYGIFDDRGGAVSCNITGAGEFMFSTGTTPFNEGTAGVAVDPPNGTNYRGLFVLTRATSNVYFEAKRLIIESLLSPNSGVWAIYQAYGTLRVRIDEIVDPNAGTTFTGHDPDPVDFLSSGQGVYWQLGQFYGEIGSIIVGGYAYWGDNATPDGTTYDFYLKNQLIKSAGTAPGCVYHNNANKLWLITHEVRGEIQPALALYLGKVYVVAEKVSTGAGSGVAAITITLGEHWLRIQKISSNGQWIEYLASGGNGGSSYTEVQHFEDVGGVTNGIACSKGTHTLQGGVASALTGNGILHTLGTLRVKGLTLSAPTSSKSPVVVAGAGLILENCVLVANASANSVTAAAAQTIKAMNVWANTAKHANVTVQCQAINLDSNVS